MKKLLALLIIISAMYSCGYAPMDNRLCIKITKIKAYDNNFCKYYGEGNYALMFSPESRFMFVDTCGKFQIGDTINFVKVK